LGAILFVGVALASGLSSQPAQSAEAAMHWRVTTLPLPPGSAGSYAEPGIVIGVGGVALVDAASANTSAPPTFWVSHDGGDTWGPGQDFDPSGASTGDADVAIGGDG